MGAQSIFSSVFAARLPTDKLHVRSWRTPPELATQSVSRPVSAVGAIADDGRNEIFAAYDAT
jgi:hypothetical protein